MPSTHVRQNEDIEYRGYIITNEVLDYILENTYHIGNGNIVPHAENNRQIFKLIGNYIKAA